MFLASYTNGVDKKGRVSVPASFRAELAHHSRPGVVVYAAPEEQYLYAWGYDDFTKFAETIKKMPPLAPERQRLARTLLAAARPLNFDDNGRIMLPEPFLNHTGITEKALFAGQGDYFTIWQPARYEAVQSADQAHYTDDITLLSEGWSQQHDG